MTTFDGDLVGLWARASIIAANRDDWLRDLVVVDLDRDVLCGILPMVGRDELAAPDASWPGSPLVTHTVLESHVGQR